MKKDYNMDEYLDGNVKFRTAYRESMYFQVRNHDTTGLFKSMTHLFYTAFAIGYYFNKKTKIAKKAINHTNLVSFDLEIKQLMVELVLKRNKTNLNPKELWREVEEYAEYGITVLYDSWKKNNIFDIDDIIS